MKERPILFSGAMVRALLAGTKTQTRRVVKPQANQQWLRPETLQRSPRAKPVLVDGVQWAQFAHPLAGQTVGGIVHDEWSPLTCIRCPHGVPGDRLIVRETWMPDPPRDGTWPHVVFDGCKPQDMSLIPEQYRKPEHCLYRADGHEDLTGWTPAIHMFRWASRITLEITGVRVERLQDISRGDAMAEGCPFPNMAAGDDPRAWYAALWGEINGPDAWAGNPWVWVIEFKRLQDAS